MGLRQNLAYQPSFRIQIHPEWPQELVQLKEELWSGVSRTVPSSIKPGFGMGVWGCGWDDSDNKTILQDLSA